MLEIFLMGIMIVSIFAGLFTQGIKLWLQERGRKYYSNALAGYVAAGLSLAVGISYMILTETAFNLKMAVYLIALILLSWLGAMIGYDKVIQGIAQIRSKGE